MAELIDKKWLREQLADLAKDAIDIERSSMPLFNKGLDLVCAIDTMLEKIITKLEIKE